MWLLCDGVGVPPLGFAQPGVGLAAWLCEAPAKRHFLALPRKSWVVCAALQLQH